MNSNINMFSLNISAQLDNLRLLENPYQEHYAAGLDDITRSHYAALLLMVLLNRGSISLQQQRMLDLWLPAIGLSGQQTMLFELADRLAKDKLGNAIHLLKKNPFIIKAFLLDVMIFSRLEQPLDKVTISLFEQLADLFNIEVQELSNIMHLATFILGLPSYGLNEPPYEMDFTPYRGWGDFLCYYRPNAAKKLFAWADKHEIPTSALPRDLQALKSVRKLGWHYGAAYWESIPDELYLLENLESLNIIACKINEIPESIGCLNNLKILTITFPNFKSLPKTMVNLNKLQKLEIQTGWSILWQDKAHELTHVPKEVVQFIKQNKIELNISSSIDHLFK